MSFYDEVTLAFVTLERPPFLAQSLASVAKDFKHVIVYDNGSQNVANRNLNRAWAQKHKCQYIHVEKNEGLPKAWNQCIIKAPTDWVVLCPDDVIFRPDWVSDCQLLMERKETKIILGNNYDMIMLHKSVIPTFGWLEERYKQYPSSEDYDMHLRFAELIGFSPYTMPGDHVQGAERTIRMDRANKLTEKEYLSEKNFTAWCTSPFSKTEVLCTEIPHPKTANYFTKDPNQETGYDFHAKKWKVCYEGEPGALLNIDGQFWKRLLPDLNPYPEVTEEYRQRYL